MNQSNQFGSTLCLKKVYPKPYYFRDNFTNCEPIQIIFPKNIAEKIRNKLTVAIFSIFRLRVASVHHNMTSTFLSVS